MSHTAVLLTEADLAARWQVSKGALANDRSAGRGIPFVKIQSRVRYREIDVEAFELDALVLASR
jgi:hypothetical protein